MAEWVNEESTGAGGNVTMNIAGGYSNVSRSGKTVSFNWGVRFNTKVDYWTYNSVCAVIDGSNWYAMKSSGNLHTDMNTWYYATSTSESTAKYTGETTPFSYSTTVSNTGSGSITVSVGTAWNEYTPAGNKHTYKFSVPYPAATSYTISYNANGGSGAPGSQTKYQGYTLTLSSTKPTRSGYEFQGWATSSSGSVAYSSGASYTNNAGATLYAVWKSLEPVFEAPSLICTETTISWNSFSTNIASNIYYQLDGTSGSWISIGSNTTTASSKTITGLTAGSSHTVYFRADNASSTSLQTTHSTTTTTYKYPYIVSLSNSNITIGSSQTITLYNPLGRSVSISIYKVNNKTGSYGNTVTTTTTSATMTIPTNAVASQFTTTTSAPIVYRAVYVSGTAHNSDYSGTVNVTNAIAGPTIDATKKNGFFTYEDVATFNFNSNVYSMSAFTGDNKKLLRGYSKLRYSLVANSNPFGGQYGASITSYKVQINSKTTTSTTIGTNYYEGLSGGTSNVNNVVVITNQNYVITISATDSRGLTNYYTIPITTYPYAKPAVNISSAMRHGGFGTEVTLSVSGTWSPNMEGVHTAKKITLYYKPTTSSSGYLQEVLYEDTGDSINYQELNITKILTNIDFESNSAYYMYVIATDGLNQSTQSTTFILSPGIPLMFIDEAQTGVGINMFPQGKGLYVSDQMVVTNNLIVNGNRVVKITKSTSDPTGGVDGDIWIKYN